MPPLAPVTATCSLRNSILHFFPLSLPQRCRGEGLLRSAQSHPKDEREKEKEKKHNRLFALNGATEMTIMVAFLAAVLGAFAGGIGTYVAMRGMGFLQLRREIRQSLPRTSAPTTGMSRVRPLEMAPGRRVLGAGGHDRDQSTDG